MIFVLSLKIILVKSVIAISKKESHVNTRNSLLSGNELSLCAACKTTDKQNE
jgi:hypothetical protein